MVEIIPTIPTGAVTIADETDTVTTGADVTTVKIIAEISMTAAVTIANVTDMVTTCAVVITVVITAKVKR